MSDRPSRNGSVALALSQVTRTFRQVGRPLDVLRGVDLEVRGGEMVALVGPSGAGKSTLLHICGLLERPTSGTVAIGGRETRGLGDAERTRLRRETIGFVYQFHHLLPEFSAVENVALPMILARKARRPALEAAAGLLGQVGLADRAGHRPAQLSGGEQQRVAIVRALANGPALLLADEPTGNLDEHTAAEVFAVLRSLVKETGVAALVATHNLELARRMDRIVELHDGRLQPGR